jgi:hypothetical protein
MRLVTGEPASAGKLDHAADTIAGLWAKHHERTYRDPARGEASSITGALQIVFCDLSTPSPERWNAYDELRALLAARGLPPEQVRFIHEARNDAEKARLFAACRAGHVAVLFGSTEKMGVGTNSSTAASRSTTSTAHGGRRTSSSATAAASDRATRTPRSRSTATRSRASSTPIRGRPSSARRGSSPR